MLKTANEAAIFYQNTENSFEEWSQKGSLRLPIHGSFNLMA